MTAKNKSSKLVFYEGWGMECCGEPIHIGDTFEEEVIALSANNLFNADYFFDNHGNCTFDQNRSILISGKVKKILAIWGVNGEKIIQIDCADGKERSPEGEDFLNGYIIELE